MTLFDGEQTDTGTRELESLGLTELSPGLPQARGGSHSRQNALLGWQLAAVTQHVAAHLSERIMISDLADLLHMSRAHFSRAFRKRTCQSPHGYLMSRRVELAKDLMKNDRLMLSDVAAACGLADQAHLNKLFKRTTGMTPGAWRRLRKC